MVNISLKFTGKFLTDPLGSAYVFYQEYIKAFKESLIALRDSVRRHTPIATKNLWYSISYKIVGAPGLAPATGGGIQVQKPMEFEGSVYSAEQATVMSGQFMPCLYGPAVEFGTKPHWPPGTPIMHWLQAVNPGMDRIQRMNLVWPVRHTISQRGTKGHFMFKKGKEDFIAAGTLEKKIDEALTRACEKIS